MELALLAAVATDMWWGEPQTRWHPVALFGGVIGAVAAWLSSRVERPLGRRFAGACLVAGFTLGVLLISAAAVHAAAAISVVAALVVQTFLIWLSVSVGELVKRGRCIDGLLSQGSDEEARRELGSLVGRDTAGLDSDGIRRATIESLAENLVDAGAAPLFYAVIGGGPLALAYRTINTMDSMFGHKTEEYIDFGWASARLDDLANWLPARLTVLLISLAAIMTGASGARSFRTALVHGRRHASPNSGWSMAATAGALDISLGGPRSYRGIVEDHGLLGDGGRVLGREVMRRAAGLVLVSMSMAVVLAILVVLVNEGRSWWAL